MSSNETFNKEINNVLRLNGAYNSDGTFKCDTASGLIKGRRDAYKGYEAFVQNLQKRNKLTSANVNRAIDELLNASERKEFVGVFVYFLKKKAKNLASMGK